MDILKQSALAWKELTEYRYQFVYGYKKTLYPINLTVFNTRKTSPFQTIPLLKLQSGFLKGK